MLSLEQHLSENNKPKTKRKKPSKKISDSYLKLITDLHKQNKSWGSTGHQWIKEVEIVSRKYECGSILDYGCGKGTLGNAILARGFDGKVSFYDPGIEKHSKEPNACDLVACVDVLEHIEPEFINDVIKHIASKMKIAGFLLISKQRAIQKLPDGRNAHLIVQGNSYWLAKLKQHFNIVQSYDTDGNELAVVVTVRDNGERDSS